MIDLHVHSTMSDGTYTPSELAQLASEVGVEAFALTDHDTISGNDEALLAALKYHVSFIHGMEMSLDYDKHQIHVVALGFDVDAPVFKSFYADLRRLKEIGITNVIEYLAKEGLDISVEKVTKYASGDELDKYAILRYLVSDENATGDIQYLWDKYIDPAFRNLNLNKNIEAEYALKAIHQSGGVTSLAHFHKKIGFKGYSREEQEHHIKTLLDMGLDGMEAYYPSYSDEDREFAHYLIEKYKMMPSGGTDFHGKNRPSVSLGTGTNNNMNVPYAFYKNICDKINGMHIKKNR